MEMQTTNAALTRHLDLWRKKFRTARPKYGTYYSRSISHVAGDLLNFVFVCFLDEENSDTV